MLTAENRVPAMLGNRMVLRDETQVVSLEENVMLRVKDVNYEDSVKLANTLSVLEHGGELRE